MAPAERTRWLRVFPCCECHKFLSNLVLLLLLLLACIDRKKFSYGFCFWCFANCFVVCIAVDLELWWHHSRSSVTRSSYQYQYLWYLNMCITFWDFLLNFRGYKVLQGQAFCEQEHLTILRSLHGRSLFSNKVSFLFFLVHTC